MGLSQADLVNVLSSSPCKTAGVVAAENIQGRIIWVCTRGANHFHEHRISILLLCDTQVTNCVQDIWGTTKNHGNTGMPLITLQLAAGSRAPK